MLWVHLFRWDKCEVRLVKYLQLEKVAPSGGFDRARAYKVWPQPFINKKPTLMTAVLNEPPNLFEDVLQYIRIIDKRSFTGMPHDCRLSLTILAFHGTCLRGCRSAFLVLCVVNRLGMQSGQYRLYLMKLWWSRQRYGQRLQLAAAGVTFPCCQFPEVFAQLVLHLQLILC